MKQKTVRKQNIFCRQRSVSKNKKKRYGSEIDISVETSTMRLNRLRSQTERIKLSDLNLVEVSYHSSFVFRELINKIGKLLTPST